MADKRINALATTAPNTASDDFLAVDGTTNGTRKLSAFSPTFGGNATVTGTLTVNGTGTSEFGGLVRITAGGFRSYGSMTLGATYAGMGGGFQTSYDTPTTRIFYGDGTGFDLRFATRASSTTTDRFTFSDTGKLTISGTDASTSTSSGALVVSGGVGVAGAIYAANLGGTSTNNNAASGCIGEYTSATTAYASKVSLTSNTAANIVSISLTAGDWDVQFNPVFTQDTPLTTSGLLAGVSSSSATLPSGAAERAHSPSGPNGNSDISIAPPVTRISLASTTTIYGVATGIFSAGTMSAYGFIRARRVR